MTGQQPRNEGATQTKLIMEAVRRHRDAKGWSAQQLADEMAGTGIPWNADVVVNLEHGRRKSLRVHELLALAWVLEVGNPMDLLVPEADDGDLMYPVVPNTLVFRAAVRAWFAGETGPLRAWLDQPREGEPVDLAAALEQMPAALREQILRLARSGAQAPRAGGDGESA